MNLETLIPLGSSILGGLFGGGNKTKSSSTPTLTPELEEAVQEIFARIPAIFNKPFPEYPGERVAGPTGSREMMNPMLDLMQGRMRDRMQRPNPYQGRVDQLLNIPPVQVGVSDLLGRNSSAATVAGGYNMAPPTQIDQQIASTPPWLQGQTVNRG